MELANAKDNILLKVCFRGNVVFITVAQFEEMKAQHTLENFELLEVKARAQTADKSSVK